MDYFENNKSINKNALIYRFCPNGLPSKFHSALDKLNQHEQMVIIRIITQHSGLKYYQHRKWSSDKENVCNETFDDIDDEKYVHSQYLQRTKQTKKISDNIISPFCSCNKNYETITHFILNCDLYIPQRKILHKSLSKIHYYFKYFWRWDIQQLPTHLQSKNLNGKPYTKYGKHYIFI